MSFQNVSDPTRGQSADILKEIRVLSKSVVVSPQQTAVEGSMIEFHLDVHREEGCTCRSGFRPSCPAWASVQLIEVELVFYTRKPPAGDSEDAGSTRRSDEERLREKLTFTLLDGRGTALRLKLKTKMPGKSRDLISVFGVLDKDEKVIRNPGQRTQIFPLNMKAVGIDVTGDDEVTEESEEGMRTFKDLLSAGKIFAEVWSSKSSRYRYKAISSDDSSDGDDDDYVCESSDEEKTSTAGSFQSNHGQSNNKHQSIQEDEMGPALDVINAPVNENLRKIGYLEFKRPKLGHAPSAAASARMESQQHAHTPKKKAHRKYVSDGCGECETFHKVDLLGRVEVVARRIEDLIRNANKAGNYNFSCELNDAGVELPDSVTLEKLGVPLNKMEETGIPMTEDQQERRAHQKEVVSIDCDDSCSESGKERDNNIPIKHEDEEDTNHNDDSSDFDLSSNANHENSRTLEATSVDDEQTRAANVNQQCPRKTLLQRVLDMESQALSDDSLTSQPFNLPSRVKNVEDALGSMALTSTGTLLHRICGVEDAFVRAKERMTKLEGQAFDATRSNTSTLSLIRRVRGVEEEIGICQNNVCIMSKIEKLEDMLL